MSRVSRPRRAWVGARALRLAVCALLVGVTGCGDPALDWRFSVDPSLEDAVVVEARVLEGGCEGTTLSQQVFSRSSGSMTPAPLPPGTYGFDVSVRDADCAIVGQGCELRTLPLDEASVTVAVAPLSDPAGACDAGVACALGLCEGEVVADAGPDVDSAVPTDAAPVDGGTDDAATPDGGPLDGGAVCDCEEATDRCEDGACVPIVIAEQVHMGRGFGCALGRVRDGSAKRVYCWGNASVGRLGTGCVGTSADPSSVSSLPNEDWTQLGVTGHACVLSASGRLFCWGGNGQGQAGPRGSSCSGNTPEPQEILVSGMSWTGVGVSSLTTCAINADGARVCFGRADQNRVGSATAVDNPLLDPTEIDDGHEWTDLIGGENGQFYGTVGGESWFYGWNDARQTSPSGLGAAPARLGFGVESFALGRGYGCQVETGGVLRCWGCSSIRASSYDGCTYGAVGVPEGRDPDPLGSFAGTESRLEIPLSGVTSVGAYDWTCAVSDGQLFCWGRDDRGSLGVGPITAGSEPAGCGTRDDPGGDGDVSFCETPQAVDSPARNWVSVDVGSSQSCAIRDGGRLYCWGWPVDNTDDAPVTSPTRMPLR